VERPAVAFDDQPAVHDEIDPSDPVELNLNLHVTAEAAQEQPHDRLRSRLGARIDELSKYPEALRQACEHLGDVTVIDKAQVQGAVKGCDRIAGRLATARLDKGFDKRRGDGGEVSTRHPPMPHDVGTWLWKAARAVRDLHMQRSMLENMHAEQMKQRDAVDAAPE
jgi:hypothetical protein